MNFHKDDIETVLRFSSQEASGWSDQLNWTVLWTDSELDAKLANIISVHEFMHNELNNTTSFGFILQSYAYLSRENIKQKKQYQEVL